MGQSVDRKVYRQPIGRDQSKRGWDFCRLFSADLSSHPTRANASSEKGGDGARGLRQRQRRKREQRQVWQPQSTRAWISTVKMGMAMDDDESAMLG